MDSSIRLDHPEDGIISWPVFTGIFMLPAFSMCFEARSVYNKEAT